ncbi:hypothetical protein QQ045_023339 [Rhodiola kirilowii]
MTRSKVKLAYIINASARRTTYRKRKVGLLRKMSEISTLCDVEACSIIYSPFEAQPVLWPASDDDVHRVLTRFRMIPEEEQSKKMVNQVTFLGDRIMKIKDQLKKQLKDSRENEMAEVMFQILVGQFDLRRLSMTDYNDLAWLIDRHMREMDICSEKLRKSDEAANAVQANAAGGADDVANRPVIPTDGPFSFDGMRDALGLSEGFVNDNSGASSSDNQPQSGLHVPNNPMMPPPSN